jgi:hypothetical protein
MLELELEQQMNIKFLVELGKSGSKIRGMVLWVYGDNPMKKTAVYERGHVFSEGRRNVTDKGSSGLPTTSRTEDNIAKVHQIVRENHQFTVRSIAEQVNIDRDTVS